MRLCQGELFDRIMQSEKGMNEPEVYIFFWQLMKALQALHKSGLLHRDVKPENLLFVSQKSNQIKLIDFDDAIEYSPKPENVMVESYKAGSVCLRLTFSFFIFLPRYLKASSIVGLIYGLQESSFILCC